MNRRDFLLAAAAVSAARVPVEGRQENPKLIFFGMTVFGAGNPIRATMPTPRAHAAFLVGTERLRALGVDTVPVSKGLEEAHVDLKAVTHAGCLGNARFTVIGSNDAPSITQGLGNRLPNLVKTATDAEKTGEFRFRSPTGVRVTLTGGELREACQESSSKGTKSDVRWKFTLKGIDVIDAIRVTDIAVFQSYSNTLRIRRNDRAGSLTLKADEVLWVLNFPTFSAMEDSNRQQIEHAEDWYRLVGFNGSVSVTTAASLAPEPSRTAPFRHPCLNETPPAGGGDPGTLGKRELPPDSDPCFMAME